MKTWGPVPMARDLVVVDGTKMNSDLPDRNARSNEADDASGHYQTAGYAIASMGIIALLLYTVTTQIFPQDLGFISHRGILFFSVLFVVVGGMMVRSAEQGNDDA